MLRYLKEFPKDTWIISKADAGKAYYGVIERARLRKSGASALPNRPPPGPNPNALPFNRGGPQMPQQQQMPMQYNGPPGHYPQQQFNGGPPGQHPPQYPQHMQYPLGHPGTGGKGKGAANVPHQQQMGYPPPGMQVQNMSQYNPNPLPPQHVLMSQPHAIPLNVPPGQQHMAMQMAQQQQQMMYGQRPMHIQQGQPQMGHPPQALPYNLPPHLTTPIPQVPGLAELLAEDMTGALKPRLSVRKAQAKK